MGMAENYKHLYEQTKKILAMYQDELIPGFRKQIEELEGTVCDLRKKWQMAETHICTMCEHFDHKVDGNIVYGNKTCGELVGYPCCGKFKLRATDNNVGDKMTPTDKDTNVLTNGDRIRAMTDAELAMFLCGRLDCYGSDCPGKHLCHPGNNGLVDWMKRPAEVE